jgi:DNA polymerase-3 subunit epsilon
MISSIMNAIDQQKIVETSFIVIDFETVTPKGRPPEPIELAALRILPGLSRDTAFKFDRLIKPPDGAPITAFDTAQTGIRKQDVERESNASTVLREFDALLSGTLCVLVAQNARYESNILQRFAVDCPSAAALPMIDTVSLAKHVCPNLLNHKLDTLAQHFGIRIPQDRHRALPDVELTVGVFLALICDSTTARNLATISQLRQVAGVGRRDVQKEAQASLFD